MNQTFGERWIGWQKRLMTLMDENQARQCYEAKKLHTVLFANADKPYCYVESNMTYVGVGFLDENLREVLAYSFQEVERGRLFLSMAIYREFKADSDDLAKATTYFFKPDGHLVIKKKDYIKEVAEHAEDTVDVSGNWEPYPEFGKYESIIRKER